MVSKALPIAIVTSVVSGETVAKTESMKDLLLALGTSAKTGHEFCESAGVRKHRDSSCVNLFNVEY